MGNNRDNNDNNCHNSFATRIDTIKIIAIKIVAKSDKLFTTIKIVTTATKLFLTNYKALQMKRNSIQKVKQYDIFLLTTRNRTHFLHKAWKYLQAMIKNSCFVRLLFLGFGKINQNY